MVLKYKYRLYPTKSQAEKLFNFCGANRYIWNHFLAEEIKQYQKEHGGAPLCLNMTVKMLCDKKYNLEAIRNDYLIDRDKLDTWHKELRDLLDKEFGVRFEHS